MMTLSKQDLSTFGEGYTQILSSTHIVVTNKKEVIKYIYCPIEEINICRLLGTNVSGVLSMKDLAFLLFLSLLTPFTFDIWRSKTIPTRFIAAGERRNACARRAPL